MLNNILAPAAVLVLWSLIMLLWMVFTRFGAFKTSGVDLSKSKPGGRGQDLDGVLPDRVNWKAHNYAHLMEQPTIFYAVVIILFLMSAGNPVMVALAWAYVILRIIHSIWQATVNKVFPTRVLLFTLSSICLLVMAIYAVYVTVLL